MQHNIFNQTHTKQITEVDFQEETHPEKDTDKRVFSQDRQLFTDSKSSFSIFTF